MNDLLKKLAVLTRGRRGPDQADEQPQAFQNDRLRTDWRPVLEQVVAPLSLLIHQAVLDRHVRLEVQAAEDDPTYWALIRALQDTPEDTDAPDWWLDEARCKWWLCLHLDWKAVGDVEFQVQAVARTLGLRADFRWDMPENANASHVPLGLKVAAGWLEVRGFTLIGVNTDSDEYWLLPVRDDRSALTRAMIERMGFQTYNPRENA